MMKTFILFSVLISQSSSLIPCHRAASRPTSALGLFGNPKDGDGKGPAIMDQLAMFKKAQEMAQKKKLLDEELKKMTFVGKGADGKVTGNFKFVPVSSPLDPNPDYEAAGFTFDKDYFESASPEELGEAIKEAIKDGIENTNKALTEKYTVLQTDLMEAFGQKKQ